MRDSLERFLDQVAQRGSWVGGGSAAALTAALSAALLEKLIIRPTTVRTLRRLRRQCLALIRQDATMFAKAVRATRSRDRRRFRRALTAATAVQAQVLRHAHALQAVCRQAKRTVHPKLQSDLRCARALASGAEASARILIQTNRAWLRKRTNR